MFFPFLLYRDKENFKLLLATLNSFFDESPLDHVCCAHQSTRGNIYPQINSREVVAQTTHLSVKTLNVDR